MSLNADVIRARCGEIEESLQRLERFRTMGREQFLVERDAQDLACYRLLVAIEAALALCYHITAKRLQTVPEDYAGCFGALGAAGIVPPELAARLRQMARFRNVLVHVYWKIDYGRVYEVLARDLGDLRSFAAVVSGLV
ncbi:MAG: DUF86 domain-containing protein [Gemmatimonadota bacterium]